MEPLVIFGACLVAWCGYLAVGDAARDMKAVRHESPAKRKAAKKRVKALTTGVRARLPGVDSLVKPHLQRI